MDILKKAFDEMPYIFTSQQFYNKARELGFPQYQIIAGTGTIFLHKNATQYYRRRTWEKKNKNLLKVELINNPEIKYKEVENMCNFNKINTEQQTENKTLPEDDIPKIIEKLKKLGYKVYKSETQWVEI